MTDQHRADALGCMGNDSILTPHLDELSQEAVTFENAFCQSPVCMASRASLFTGRYPATMGIRGMGILPPREVTTPEVFRRNGYHTAAFGKLHLTPQQYTRDVLQSFKPILDLKVFAREAGLGDIPNRPFRDNYGFAEHWGYDDALHGNFREWLLSRQPDLLEASREPVSGAPKDCFISPYPSAFHPTTCIGSHTEDFIRSRSSSEPWLAFCSFVAPHHPFEAPADQIEKYGDRKIPLPEREEVDLALLPERLHEDFRKGRALSPEGLRRVILHYYASISLIDDNVGKLTRALKETGQWENTIVLFNSDHGEFLGNHGLLRKPSAHYDDTLRVPLLLRLPGKQAGQRERGLVELVDVHPTLLALAGLERNPGVQGRDLSAALLSGKSAGREDIHADMHDDILDPDKCRIISGGGYASVQTLRTSSWKLNIYPRTSSAYGQLFHLEEDPGERKNLFGDPHYRPVREEMLWKLTARLAGQADPLPHILSQY